MRPSEPQPDLTICIVSWNVREALLGCLRSLREVGGDLAGEILVVDNGSVDGTAARVEEAFPEVVVIRNRQNRGFAVAVNQAIRGGRGRYFLLLNPDTLVPRGSLEEMVRFLDQHPSAGGAGPRLVNPDGSLQPSVRSFPTRAAALGEFTILGALGFFRSARVAYHQAGFDYTRPAIVDQPMGAALFLRREALEEVGLLDEGFFLYFEEVDLCRRLTRAGWPLWYNPAAEITHQGGESTRRAGGEALYYLFQSQFRYFLKVYGVRSAGWFKLVFKPLALLDLYWAMILSGVFLGGAYLIGRPAGIRERKLVRWRLKWDFLSRRLLDFILL